MTEARVPTYAEMLLPTLVALDTLGDSGTNDEIDETTIQVMRLTPDQLAVNFPPEARQTGSKVIHRLAWARTYLKKFGAVNNSRRGVWTLEPKGRQFLTMDATEAADALRSEDSEIRKQRRLKQLVKSDIDEDGEAEGVNEEAITDEDGVLPNWRTVLLDRLLALRPDAFERLAQRLLREAGFKNVEVLGRSGDGGLDGVGVYRPSLVSFPIFFQCKRYRDSVGPGQVRDFRGAMAGRGEKGLLITTGIFTAEAKREATRDGAPPVELIDGGELCDLLKEYGVGVETRTVESVAIQDSYFESL
jgi:restriction system protein